MNGVGEEHAEHPGNEGRQQAEFDAVLEAGEKDPVHDEIHVARRPMARVAMEGLPHHRQRGYPKAEERVDEKRGDRERGLASPKEAPHRRAPIEGLGLGPWRASTGVRDRRLLRCHG